MSKKTPIKAPAKHHMDKSLFFSAGADRGMNNDIKKFPVTSRYTPLAKDENKMKSYLKIEKAYKDKADKLSEDKRNQLKNFIIRPGAERDDITAKKNLEKELDNKQQSLKKEATKKAKIEYRKDGLAQNFNLKSTKGKTSKAYNKAAKNTAKGKINEKVK